MYPGNELASLTDQWTNQVYRLALRIPTLPLPEAGNVQGCAACYDVTEESILELMVLVENGWMFFPGTEGKIKGVFAFFLSVKFTDFIVR